MVILIDMMKLFEGQDIVEVLNDGETICLMNVYWAEDDLYNITLYRMRDGRIEDKYFWPGKRKRLLLHHIRA